jgi:hypothetical protein
VRNNMNINEIIKMTKMVSILSTDVYFYS